MKKFKKMKKIMTLPIALILFLIIVFPQVTYGMDKTTATAATNLNLHQNLRKGHQTEYGPVKNIYSNNLIDFSKKNSQTSKWSAKYFPRVFSDDIDHINSVNHQLRTKYMNRSDLYDPFSDLEELDKSFVTETSEDIELYANLTPEDFVISSKYYSNNSEKVYNDMLKETLFGIDHGYFIGSLDKKNLDHSKNEYIQISLIIPKGSKITRVGNLSENQYIIPRDTTLSYTGKNFNTDSKDINISAQLVDRGELDKATKAQEDIINTKMNTLYGTPSNLVTLTPLGLNAGHILTSSLNIVSNAFEQMNTGNILSKNLFDKQKFNLTSGWIVHTDVFDKWTQGDTLEERRKLFEKKFDTNNLGATQIWKDKTCESIINLSHLGDVDNLTQMGVEDLYIATLLHETFHYLIHSSNYFEDQPLFQDDPEVFEDMMTMLKDEEEDDLVDLLNDSYAESDWEEFICEAFMAKFHPNDEIRNRFTKEIPQTNRMLDNIFDHTPPTVPSNLKELEANGTSVKLTFDHATDNIGVDSYNIYQNGKLVKTEITKKDDNNLSYPDPGNHQKNIELTVDNLKQFTDYDFQVSAVDDAQHESAKSSILKIKTKDTEPPKLTGSLTGSPLVSTAARLNWPHPTDNDKVKEVKLYRSESSSISDNFGIKTPTKQEQTFIIPGNENYYTDLTIEKGKTYTYSMVAVDESGNESEKSNSITIKAEDKDDEKQNQDKAEDVTFSKATLNWDGAFSGISASGFNVFSWVFSGGSWVFSGVASVSGTATSSVVGLAAGLSHQFVVVPVDSNGNPLASGLQISVDSVDKSSIQTKDSTLYVGQNWNKEDNFVSATDEDGNAVPYSDNRITTNDSSIDTSKPGVYEIKYSYKGVAKTSDSTFKVTVKEDKSSIKTKDSTLYVGQNWNKEANFVSATDEEGNAVPYSDKRITSDVSSIDTSKPGVYEVKYSYKGILKTSDSTFKVTVKEDKSSIKTKDSTLYVGQNWNKEDNFVSATDEEGNAVPYSDKRITSDVSSIDTSKPGVYEVKYSYKGILKTSDSTFKVTVKEDKSSIKTKDSTLYVGQNWNKEDNFVSATDEEGNAVPYSDNRITSDVSNIDTSKPGVYEVKYSYKGVVKTSDSTFKVTVKEDKSSIQTKDSTLYVGQNWNKEDNFVSATDEDGNSVPYSDNRITTDDSSIDTSKPGVYEVKYSYKGILKTSDSTFKVTVKEDKSSIKTKNSIIYVGQNWNKENNFVSATDEDGNSVPYSDNRITTNDSNIDTSKPGVYEVKYSYKGILKTSDSTFNVTVVSKEEWFSQIVEAHKSWGWDGDTDTDTTVSQIEFDDPNLVEIMKHQPYSYRVVYTDNLDSSHNFDVTKPAKDPDPYFRCVFVDFREYNQGNALTYKVFSYDTEIEIYVVLENGDQIKVFDTDDIH